MTDDRIDLSVLTPSVDALVRRIGSRCAPALAERRRAGMIVAIAGWRRPMLVAAALVALVSGVILARAPGQAAITRMPPPYWISRPPVAQLATVLGVPDDIADRLTTRRPPTLGELMTGAAR